MYFILYDKTSHEYYGGRNERYADAWTCETEQSAACAFENEKEAWYVADELNRGGYDFVVLTLGAEA